jgi:LmbE family N-acetylglucosaminyl deacetylase
MKKKIIVISAHPDDEVLGVGGTLAKHSIMGDVICWIIVTNRKEIFGYSKEQIAERQLEIESVKVLLGINKVETLNYNPGKLTDENLVNIINDVSRIFNEFKPEIIYTLNRSDAHSDHRIISDAVMSCTKSFRYSFIKTILMYECISETEFAPTFPEKVFIPNYFSDISNYMGIKLKAMSIYKSELAPHPFPRNLENITALATYRGAIAGVKFAEAFQLVRHIEK